jgi:hypothetical protein
VPLIVDDKSKDEVLDKIMERIVELQKEYHDKRGWLGWERRAAIREEIAKHAMNYNTIVVKRANRAEPNKLPSLYKPGPQSELENTLLLSLIDST